MKKLLLIILLATVILISGCVQEPDLSRFAPSADPSNALNSSRTWLVSGLGSENFQNNTIGQVHPVFREDDQTLFLWIVTMKNREGFYTGFFVTDDEYFEIPSIITKFGIPKVSIFSVTREEAYAQILEENSEYSSNQITEPFLVSRPELGYYWASNIVANNMAVKTSYVSVEID